MSVDERLAEAVRLLAAWLQAADSGHWRDKTELSIAAHPVADRTRGWLDAQQQGGGA